jgi:trimeric autotransporter adhesin
MWPAGINRQRNQFEGTRTMRIAHGRQHGLPTRRNDISAVLFARIVQWLSTLGTTLTSRVPGSLCAALLFAAVVPAHADVQYVYDAAGRVVQVIAADGTSAQYEYDAAGNITAIKRLSAGQLAITAFTPSSGPIGTAVTISGSGFSATASQNTVQFNGTTAVVTVASANQLTVNVPAGASTGTIAVTTPGGSAVSADPFTVTGSVSITGFSPSLGASGTVVIVSGSSLNPFPGQTALSLNGRFVPISSITDQQIQFTVPANVGSGRITVVTPNGSATSSAAFLVVPSGIVPGSVTPYPALSTSASQAVNLAAPNQQASLTFEGAQNDYLSLQLSSFTSSNNLLSAKVYDPTNSLIATATLSPVNPTLHLPRLLLTGTYSVYFGSGSGTHQFTVSLDRDADTELTGSPVNLAGAVSQSKRLVFRATAGQTIGIGTTNLAVSPNPLANFKLVDPDGSPVGSSFSCNGAQSSPGCSFNFRQLPLTGTYQLVAEPSDGSTMSLTAAVSAAFTGTLALDNPFTINLASSGQNTWYDFTVGAGDTVAFNVASIASTPAGKTVSVTVYNSSGAPVGSSALSTSNATVNLSNLAAGTYRVLVWVADGSTATMQATLASRMGEALTLDGTSHAYASTVFNQQADITFSATVGQTIGIGITNLSTSQNATVRFTLLGPNGFQVGSQFDCPTSPQPGCTFAFLNLAQTGTYRLRALPITAQASMSFTVTLSSALTGTLALNTPISINLGVPAQNTWLDFTVTAGQSRVFTLTSITSVPVGNTVSVQVFNSAGGQVGSASGTSSATVNLPSLSAGTYRVHAWVANGATATMQGTLQ